MLTGIKKGLTGLALTVALAVSGIGVPGCAVSYRDGLDKVDFSVAVFPGVGAGEVKHTVFRDYEATKVECAFDSSIVGNIFGGGAYEMKVSGENREFLWKYRIEAAGKSEGKPIYKLRVWDSSKNSSDWMYSIPDFLPCSVKAQASGSSFSNLTGSTYYYNLREQIIDPKDLLTDTAKKFVRESVRK